MTVAPPAATPEAPIVQSSSATHAIVCLGRPRFPSELGEVTDIADAWSRLIDRHGPAEAAARVGGDWAIALKLNDGRTVFAVDRFAVRSLCWRLDGDSLRIAERADALPAADALGLDTQAIFDYLYFHVIPSPRTVHPGVQRLPPGHVAVFDGKNVQVQRYWTPSFRPTHRPDFESLKQSFRGLLREAVAHQLDGSNPACFLSGGTDSSTVAGLLAQVADRKPVCYSIGFAAEGYDEMDYARIAARHFGCEHREIYFTADDLVRQIPMVAAAYDQPFGNSSALPSYHCATQARADGITRILAGDGGDELFGGNSRYATQRLFDHWQRVPRPLRDRLLAPLLSLPVASRIPLVRKAASYMRQACQPMPDRVQDYNLIRRIGYGTLFTPAFLAQVDEVSVEVQQRAVWAEARATGEIDRHLAYDWRYTLADCDLPKVVGTTGLAGLSVGFPMLDDALVDFSQQLPEQYKLNGRALRWFFKEALRGFLPIEVINKPKQGFGLPFGVWMVQHPGLNTMTRDALRALVDRGLLQASFVRSFFEELLPQHPHYYGTIAWILIMLEHWLRRHSPDWRIGT